MRNDIAVTENEWIPLPDGRRLAARSWRPVTKTPVPAILEYLPYRKRDGTAPRDETTHPVFARAGYACIRVDITGTGDSDGVFDDEYSEQELADGEAVLNWIAGQSWCDGNIGIIGISWGGFNGLQLAYRQPASLKAVVSVASTTDRYADDIHYMGGCLLSDNVNWGAQMFAYLTRPADPDLRPDWREDWIDRLENNPFCATDWLRHPVRDAFWKHGSVCEDFSRLKAPVLTLTGWADAYLNAPPRLAAQMQAPCKAMIGPWEHRYPHIALLHPADFHTEVINWFDRWLRNKPNGVENLPDYRTFMQDHFNPTKENKPRKGRWIAEQNWPSSNVNDHPMYLRPGGFETQPGEGSITVSNPAHIGQAGGYFCPGMRVDNELAEDQAPDDLLSTCFDTEPRHTPLEILGRARLKFAFSVDQPTAQLVARLCDVSPQGVSQRITYRALNLTHYQSHEAPEYLEPGQIYEAELELNECAHRVLPGHGLRLALSTSYWPIVWPHPKSANITLHLDRCALHLPVRQVEHEIDPQNPGPAQDYPTLQAETLRPMDSSSSRRVLEDGTLVLDTFDDYGQTRDPYHGLIAGSSVRMSYSVHPDDPTTARYDCNWQFTFERGDWQVEIQTSNSMTCDAENFHLSRSLKAIEGAGQTEVLTKDWAEVIPRGFL